jgi:O-antigen ligase/tetratricopeptide (TPR) repeat protein
MNMRIIAFIVLASIMLLSPFLKGLYFDHSFYPIQLLIEGVGLLTILYCLLKREKIKVDKNWLILLLPFMLLITMAVAETPQGALNQVLRWISFSVFFLLLYWVSHDRKLEQLFPYVFGFSGAILSIFSMLVFLNFFLFEGMVVNERLGGVFQYPNTYASALGMFFLFSLMMLTEEEKTWRLFIYSVPTTMYVTNMLLTESRGGFVVFIVCYFLGLLLLNVREQIQFLLYTLVSAISGLTVYLILFGANEWLGLFSALIVSLFASWLHLLIKRRAAVKVKWKKPLIPIILFAVVVLGVLDLIFKGAFYSVLPISLQDKIHLLRLTTDTLKERWYIAKDSLSAIKESPVIGFGGDGWTVLFTNYQSLPYQTKSLHNGYLEWLVNTGLLGFCLFLVVFGMFFMQIIRRYRFERKSVYAAVIISLLIVFLHSLIEFHFSYGSMWFFMIWLFVMGLPKTPDTIKKGANIIGVGALSIMLMIGIFSSYRMLSANEAYKKARESTNIHEQLIYLSKAVKVNPYRVEQWNALGKTYLFLFKKTNSEQALKQVKGIAFKMASLEPNSSKTLFYSADLLHDAGLLMEANKMVDKALDVDHYNSALYEKSLQLKIELAIKMKKQKELQKIFAQQAINDFYKNQKWYNIYIEKAPAQRRSDFNSRKFTITNKTMYFAALSKFIAGRYEETLNVLDKINGTKNNNLFFKVMALKAVSLKKLGEIERSLEIEKQYKHHQDFEKLLKELDSL